MTYAELKEILSKMTQEELEQDATIYVGSNAEYFPLTGVAVNSTDDVLDKGHVILSTYGYGDDLMDVLP